MFPSFPYGNVSSVSFCFQDVNYAYATRQRKKPKIRACEHLQKFCEHEQASSHLFFASNSNKGQILRALSNWMGPFDTPYNFFSKTVVGLFTQNSSDINHQKRVKTLGVELKPKLVVRRVPASKSPHLHHTGEILKQCRGFTQKNALCVFRPHYAGEI